MLALSGRRALRVRTLVNHARAIADWSVGSPRALNECEPRERTPPSKGTPRSPLPPASPKRRGHVSAAYAFPDDVTNIKGETRVESDLLGSMIIPVDALYGIATARAMDNYDISGVRVRDYPEHTRVRARQTRVRHRKRTSGPAPWRCGGCHRRCVR